jgi:hypothetical protein
MTDTPGPLFVAGLERSGTSLIFAMLASHSRIAMTRRTNLWTHFYGQYGDLADPANLDRCLAMMMRYKRVLKLEPDADRLRSEFLDGERTYGRLFALLEEHHAQRMGKPRWGDKSLNTEKYTDPIFAAYPNARIIHMMRDPRDRYASSLTRWKSRRGGVGAGTAEWVASSQMARRHSERYPDRYMVLRYEDLVADPEGMLQIVCNLIDETYEPEMLAMQGAPSLTEKGFNSSYGPLAHNTISTRSIGRYRTVLSPSQIAFIESTAEAQMRRLDYEFDHPRLGALGKLAHLTTRVPLERGRYAAWQIRESFRDRRGRPVPQYRLVAPT